MKKLTLVFALVLLATSSFAQDDIVLSNSDIDALLGGGNRNNRGGRGNNNQPQIPDPISLHAQLKDLLKNNKVALDKNQDKALLTFLNTETVAMQKALEEQFRGNNNQGNRGNNSSMTMITDLSAAVTKYNAELLTEVKAGVSPDQAALITKGEKDKKICSVALDLVNFQQLLARNQQNNNNNRGGGPGGFSDFGGDIGELFGGGGGGGRGGGFPNNNNNSFNQLIPQRPSCTQSNSTTAQRLAVLGEILTKGKKPFTPDQETKVAALIEGKMKLMTDELKVKNSNMDQLLNELNRTNNNNNQNRGNQAQTPQPATVNVQTLTNNIVNTIMQSLGIQTNNNNNNNNQGNRGGGNRGNFDDGGGRGPGRGGGTPPAGLPALPATATANANQNNPGTGGRGNNNFNNFNPQQEIQKKSEELYDKVAAMLKPEQGAIVTKLKYDQIKAKGGVDRFRGILGQEGTPLAPEQITQVQSMLNAQNQAIRNAATALVQKEIQALPEGALQAAAQQYLAEQERLNQQQQNPQQQNPRNNNNNLSSVNQNTVAQQIIQKTLPDVSKQKALLEKTTLDQIMTRVFTPPQVASYKLSSM